jgi:hypothetical protein
MSSFEWMELQTLTSDINAARTRLATARANKDNRLARMLEQEITAAEKRRDHLLTNITTQLAADSESDPAGQDPDLGRELDAAEDSAVEGDGEHQSAELVDAPVGRGAAAAAKADSVGGDIIVWNQLTPSDLARAKEELAERRAEILARHAEEMKAFDADQNQLDGLEQAIDAFLSRFAQPAADAAVVRLGEERESRRA